MELFSIRIQRTFQLVSTSDGDTTTTSVKEDEKNDAVSAASMYDEVKDYI